MFLEKFYQQSQIIDQSRAEILTFFEKKKEFQMNSCV